MIRTTNELITVIFIQNNKLSCLKGIKFAAFIKLKIKKEENGTKI